MENPVLLAAFLASVTAILSALIASLTTILVESIFVHQRELRKQADERHRWMLNHYLPLQVKTAAELHKRVVKAYYQLQRVEKEVRLVAMLSTRTDGAIIKNEVIKHLGELHAVAPDQLSAALDNSSPYIPNDILSVVREFVVATHTAYIQANNQLLHIGREALGMRALQEDDTIPESLELSELNAKFKLASASLTTLLFPKNVFMSLESTLTESSPTE